MPGQSGPRASAACWTGTTAAPTAARACWGDSPAATAWAADWAADLSPSTALDSASWSALEAPAAADASPEVALCRSVKAAWTWVIVVFAGSSPLRESAACWTSATLEQTSWLGAAVWLSGVVVAARHRSDEGEADGERRERVSEHRATSL